jgi:hypothetical protein
MKTTTREEWIEPAMAIVRRLHERGYLNPAKGPVGDGLMRELAAEAANCAAGIAVRRVEAQ